MSQGGIRLPPLSPRFMVTTAGPILSSVEMRLLKLPLHILGEVLPDPIRVLPALSGIAHTGDPP